MLNEQEKKVIASLQGDMPVTEKPYQILAQRAGLSEPAYIQIVKDLKNRGIIRRFGATLRHQNSGFKANAMIAWQVPEDIALKTGEIMAAFQAVSHCYRRNPVPEWPYNLYTMVHAKTENECYETADKISKATGIKDYTLLFSRRELKKTSMTYFGK